MDLNTNHSKDYLFVDEFSYQNKAHLLRLAVDAAGICSWSMINKHHDKPPTEINLADVLIVQGVNNDHYFLDNEHQAKRRQKAHSSSILDSSQIKPCYSFEIHFAVRRDQKFRIEKATFCSPNVLVVAKWIEELQKRINSFCNRPRDLLVFLNPYGGRKKASEIYERKVKPLFNLVGIQTTLLITERANHAYDYLLQKGWQNVDGIVCIGGDGTLSEVLNGILMRLAQQNNVNLNESNVDIPTSDIRIGVIPAGSTDTVAYSLHGTTDVETAVIHILIGDFVKSDVCCVHSNQDYLCSFISLMSYGILGDVIKNSNNLRWMGPFRYDCAGARHFICHKSYEGTVSFFNGDSSPYSCDIRQSICLKNDCHCVTEPGGNDFKIDNNEKRELIRGKFFMVTAANISCACSRSPNGIAPYCHFSDGYLRLLLIRRVTFCEKIKLLLTLSNSSKGRLVNNLSFVEMYKSRHFTFETGYGSGVIPATKISSWNIDGELLQMTHLHVRCHQQKMKIFCRRKQVD